MQQDNHLLNSKAEDVADLTPDDIKPKTDTCTKAFDIPEAPPTLLTLNPGGYIPLEQGGKQTVTVAGGKAPYDVRIMCDCYKLGFTASMKVAGAKTTLEIAASDSVPAASYPLLVSDATGVGRSLVVMVSQKAPADTSDTPDCPTKESIQKDLADAKAAAGAAK